MPWLQAPRLATTPRLDPETTQKNTATAQPRYRTVMEPLWRIFSEDVSVFAKIPADKKSRKD